jgi:hypothetical protein
MGAGPAAGEEALAEGAERDEADAQLGAGGQDFGLGVAGPQRVLALDRRHWVYRVCPPDRGGCGFGQAEVAYLADLNYLTDCAGDVLDRHCGVDAMLVEVDNLRAQLTQ